MGELLLKEGSWEGLEGPRGAAGISLEKIGIRAGGFSSSMREREAFWRPEAPSGACGHRAREGELRRGPKCLCKKKEALPQGLPDLRDALPKAPQGPRAPPRSWEPF